MRTLTRRGFTLLELLVTLIVLAIASAMVVSIVGASARVAGRSGRALVAMRMQHTLHLLLAEELRVAAPADIDAVAPSRLRYQRPVGEALVCGVAGASVFIGTAAWRGTRLPEAARDHLWLLDDPSTAAWSESTIAAVAVDRCPVSGNPAIRLDLAVAVSAVGLVRVGEPVELEDYLAAGSGWLGLLAVPSASPVQPIAGPFERGSTRFQTDGNRIDITLQPRGDTARVTSIPLLREP